ncbi:aminoadipate-semialdehyde dehydrogenase [Fusarium heterosporum]|uniref:Aminoadipate-semialdehyde dehydrogenase n=1 Tax=Fusarium heterosporum TaxID=42747 RepID=A0A8H5WM04_FUSHE|nr:aminoadipate-semialdehyde dehydrogenase [Fusarium heterosporum]
MVPGNRRNLQSEAHTSSLHKTQTGRIIPASASMSSTKSSPVARTYRPEFLSDDSRYILATRGTDESNEEYLSLDFSSSSYLDPQSSWSHSLLPTPPLVNSGHAAPLAIPSPITFVASLPTRGIPMLGEVENDVIHQFLDKDGQRLGGKGCALWTQLRHLTNGLRTASDEKVSCSDAFKSGTQRKVSLPHDCEDKVMGRIYAESKRVADMHNLQGLPSHFEKISSGTDSIDFSVCLFGANIDDLHPGINRKWQDKPSVHTISRCEKVVASVAIGIETSGGGCTKEEGRDRLVLWITSHIQSIKRLFARKSASQLLSTIALPLLYAQGADWYIFFARLDHDLERVIIYSGGYIGTTSTKKGIYVLRDVLKRLREFVTEDFQDWWYKVHVEVDKQRGIDICEERERHIYRYPRCWR